MQTIMKRINVLVAMLCLFVGATALASTTRTVDADQILNSTHTITTTIPALTGTLMVSSGMVSEVPSGTVNGTNTAFTMTGTPASLAVLSVYVDGILQRPTTDYSFSGTTLTFVSAPALGQDVRCKYSKF